MRFSIMATRSASSTICPAGVKATSPLGHKSAVSLTVADICELSPDDATFEGARRVFHFAGIGDIVPSIERPTEYMRTNVRGTVRVLECARHAGVEKFVYAASSSCNALQVPTREDHASTRIIPTPSASTSASSVSLAPRLRPASERDQNFQCLRPTRQDHRRLWRRFSAYFSSRSSKGSR